MQFTWDERKNRSNLAKHNVSFEIASRVFEDPRPAASSIARWMAKTDGKP